MHSGQRVFQDGLEDGRRVFFPEEVHHAELVGHNDDFVISVCDDVQVQIYRGIVVL